MEFAGINSKRGASLMRPQGQPPELAGHLPAEPGIIGATHRSLPDRVAAELRDWIVDGPLNQGERLVEQALAERLGVSRIPLREAIAQLETEGLVHRLPRRGVVVATMTVPIVSDLFDVRLPLESLAARQATERANKADLVTLDARLAATVKATNLGDQSAVARTNAVFHAEIIRIARNPFLDSFMQPLSSQLRWTFRITGRIDANVLCAEHQQICSAIRDGDAGRAERLSYEHIERTRKPTLDVLADLQGATAGKF